MVLQNRLSQIRVCAHIVTSCTCCVSACNCFALCRWMQPYLLKVNAEKITREQKYYSKQFFWIILIENKPTYDLLLENSNMVPRTAKKTNFDQRLISVTHGKPGNIVHFWITKNYEIFCFGSFWKTYNFCAPPPPRILFFFSAHEKHG